MAGCDVPLPADPARPVPARPRAQPKGRAAAARPQAAPRAARTALLARPTVPAAPHDPRMPKPRRGFAAATVAA
jgi:hypothetical protein